MYNKKIMKNPRCYIGVPGSCIDLINIIQETTNIPVNHLFLCLKKIRFNNTFRELADDFSIHPTYARSCFVIPRELPSLLDTAFLPPVKKGTDSRIGFGFAFGNHADFQVMLELGPQTYNMNLSGQPFPNNRNNKRQAPALPTTKINKNKEKNRESDAGKYLQNWAKKIKSQPKLVKQPEKPNDIINLKESVDELVKNEKDEYEIHQPKPEHIPQSILDNLKILYDQKEAELQKMIEKKRTEEETKKITEDLSNVDMD